MDPTAAAHENDDDSANQLTRRERPRRLIDTMPPRTLCALSWALAALAAAAPKEDAHAMRKRALALYKQHRYDRACALLSKVVQAQPENGAAWADLGLCESKRGHDEA